jgi:hypothetical protein
MIRDAAAKGRRVEKKCVDALKAEGYLTMKKTRTKWHVYDLFQLFDVAALACDGSVLKLIQCKSNYCDKATRDRIAALPVPSGVQKWVWVWKDREGWRKVRL